MTRDLDLAPIGNCAVSALIDRNGRFVWSCLPRFDSDPFFSNLLGAGEADDDDAEGLWSIKVIDLAETTQAYLRNTAILRTEIRDAHGEGLEILDFAPRFPLYDRQYKPTSFVRLIRPLAGAPRIRVHLRPTADWGAARAADVVRSTIEARAWNPRLERFSATFGGDELDASLTQLVDLRFLGPDDPRHRGTLKALEAELRRGSNFMRYARADDLGRPETAFNFCTFWFIEGLHLIGETDEARGLFEEMLARRNHAGMLSEDVSLTDGTLWDNYPRTYSLAGLINCAMLLSRPWSSAR